MFRDLVVYTLLMMPTAAFALPTQQEIVEAHGADRLYEVEEVRFTFNVTRGDSTTSRTFEWNPHSNVVVYTEPGQEEPLRFDRDELDGASEAVIAADKKFINDSYWLMFPVHLMWSEDELIKPVGEKEAPISAELVPTVSIVYPSEEGGYTPGDRYDLYLNEENRPIEWTFHRGGAEEASLANTFEDYQQLGPLIVAADHYNADNSFRLFFTDLAVKWEAGAEWEGATSLD